MPKVIEYSPEDIQRFQDRIVELEKNIEDIRIAMRAYKDSDLASLAKSTRLRNEFLEKEVDRLQLEIRKNQS